MVLLLRTRAQGSLHRSVQLRALCIEDLALTISVLDGPITALCLCNTVADSMELQAVCVLIRVLVEHTALLFITDLAVVAGM